MKYIVRKAYMDFEKEEKFLNEMSAKGLALSEFSWCKYVFDETPRVSIFIVLRCLNIQMTILKVRTIRFMAETGVDVGNVL